MKVRVLLTGGSGFTGRYVAAALGDAGREAITLEEAIGKPVDLLDREAVRRAVRLANADVVVHLAAVAYVAHEDVAGLYAANIVGTRNLLEAVASGDRAPSNVILASSANIYGNVEGRIAEDTAAAPQNDYAVSKLAMEHMAHLWAGQLPLTVVRPFNYTGVGQSDRFLIPKIVAHFRERRPVLELGNLDVWREFNDVRDVAQVYGRLATRPGIGETLNVCSGAEHSLRDVLELAEDISGYAPEVRVNPAFVRANEVVRLSGDTTRLEAAVGPVPRRPLADTLRWMLSS
ncbi:NAD-dependent epimerase/dehydratase family protein [Tolypothrix campylonemoides VB511288]|nr:NAD-dependent epimerase/dehydratase family protein [Tolypothrix campylonemoides VB511288]